MFLSQTAIMFLTFSKGVPEVSFWISVSRFAMASRWAVNPPCRASTPTVYGDFGE